MRAVAIIALLIAATSCTGQDYTATPVERMNYEATIEAYGNCINKKISEYAVLDEPLDLLARAAVQQCSAQSRKLYSALIEYYNSSKLADHVFEGLKREVYENIIANIIDLRAMGATETQLGR